MASSFHFSECGFGFVLASGLLGKKPAEPLVGIRDPAGIAVGSGDREGIAESLLGADVVGEGEMNIAGVDRGPQILGEPVEVLFDAVKRRLFASGLGEDHRASLANIAELS